MCGKAVIGAYREKTAFPVYCQSCWWTDKWDPMVYGSDYDFNKPFFEQMRELQNKVPRQHINNTEGSTSINSDYTNCAGELKNCYLIFGALRDEDCAYGHYINDSHNCVDVLYCFKSQNCYSCLDIESCYNLFYSHSCVQCRDSFFLFDCRNCSHCIGCVGLRNKQYCILNTQYSKEAFEKAKEALRLHTSSGLAAFKEKFLALSLIMLRKYYHGQMNKDFSGDYIASVENTHESFYIKNARGCKFVFWCNNAEDVYDYFSWGDAELAYECVSTGQNTYRSSFIHSAWNGNKEIEYSSLCFSSSYLFGCIGLRNKKYCILNKQYSEEEYRKLRVKIIEQMREQPYTDKKGNTYSYGEFFPLEISPFYYTDSVAQEHFPLTKEQVLAHGLLWEDPKEKAHEPSLRPENVPETIKEVPDTIGKEIIGCLHQGKCNEQCTFAFKITPFELTFYRRFSIPLPQLCHNCRHYERVKMRSPLKLWHRRCACTGTASENGAYTNTISHAHGVECCPNEFETSYAPDRPEIVYCEQCYQAEVV